MRIEIEEGSMQPMKIPVTGNEYQCGQSTPFGTLTQFYNVFHNRMMSLNRVQSDNVAMDVRWVGYCVIF